MNEGISIKNKVCKAFYNAWFTKCHARYVILKGGRNTGKSHNIFGVMPIIKIIDNPIRNIIMLRANDVDNANSTYANLVDKINDLGLNNYFKCTKSPYKITYLPTGQVILFRGLNNPTGLTSIKAEKGFFTDVFFEESFEVKNYDDFRKIDGSIRGICPEGVYLQIYMAFNAWDVGSWLYDVFFKGRLEDNPKELEEKGYQELYDPEFNLGFGKGLYLHISSYKCNDYRDLSYDDSMRYLKEKSYDLYLVEGLGCFGNTKDAVYPEFNDGLIIHPQEANKMRYSCAAIGIDTGLSNGEGKILRGEDVLIRSATTMQLVGLTEDSSKIICINEFFHSNEQTINKKGEPELMVDIINKIKEWQELYMDNWTLLKGTILVYVDCADIGFRQGLELRAREYGLYNVRFMPSTKMKIQTRVDFERTLMAMGEIKYSESCPNLIREIKNARRGDKQECRADINNHALDAHEYAEYPLLPRLIRWSKFKARN